MNKISGIYKITNLINNKIYIGCSKNITSRTNLHKYKLLKNTHENDHLQKAWNKYGAENFVFEILEECLNELLLIKENYWVRLTNCLDKNIGYNIIGTTDSKNRIFSIETRTKMSISGKLKIRSKKHCENISKSKKGMISPNLGKKHSIETKAKMKQKAIGRKMSDEAKLKMSNSAKGKTPTNIKEISKFTMENIFIESYNSISKAAINNNISRTTIINNLKNRSKSAGNFIWKYKE